MSACPAPEAFSAFASGQLAEHAREALEVHVDSCASCRITLSELGRGARPAVPAITGCIGRYELAEELGAGAMGVVYRARDPELDREVAIKVLHAQPGVPENVLVQQRMLREGRALARIDHPNVVRVFDVGSSNGTMFVAMERAAGVSLRVWLAEPRSPRAIVEVFVQCARGLAAAHEAGVIHRDFKPDNVVVDAGGHARVMDFGLAQTGGEAPTTAPTQHDADVRITRTRGVVGTPAYMAPEQHRGEPIDARADQYAWGVALAEALGDARPFTAKTIDALLVEMRGTPTLSSTLPNRARRVLVRAIAFTPGARFPTMTAAADALAPRRLRWPLVALAAVAMTVLGLALLRPERDACDGVDAPITVAWSGARAERIAGIFAAASKPFATRAWQYARASTDNYARDWRVARIGVCRAGVQRGELDSAARSRIVHCLDRRVIELEAVLARWEVASIDALAAAPSMVDRLTAPARCSALETVSDDAPRAFAARFAAATVAADAGQPLEAEALLTALAAELVPHPALRAEVLTRLASVERDLGKRDAARAHLLDALAAAESIRADRPRARAWIALAQSSAEDFSRAADARESLHLASAVLEHLDHPIDLARMHDSVRGLVALHENALDEAVEALRRSNAPSVPPTERAHRMQMLARALIARGDHAGALVELDRASQLLIQTLGPDAPQLVYVLNSSMEPLEYLGRGKEAIARGERALALLDASYGTDNPRRTQLLGNLATMYANTGDRAKARTLQEEVVRASERQLGPSAVPTANAHVNLASTLSELADYTAAIEHLERAKAIYTTALGADAPQLATVHSSLAGAHSQLRRPAEALAHAERALAIREAANVPPGYLAYTRYVVAQALLEAGQRAPALAMARRALELPLGDTGREAELAKTIRAWLAAHAKR